MKSEYEKMLANDWYDANYSEELLNLRKEAQDLCFEYNHLKPSNSVKKDEVIKEIFGEVPKGLELVAPIWVDYGKNTSFGENVFVNRDSYFMDGAKISFGDNVFIGPNCGFYTANHPEDIEERNKGLEQALPITVKSNVWLGANVSVMPGVTIGEGAIIGAGSVVTKDIPNHVVAVGVPCKVVREID